MDRFRKKKNIPNYELHDDDADERELWRREDDRVKRRRRRGGIKPI